MKHAIAAGLLVLQLSVAPFAQESLIRSQQEQSAALASQWIHDADPKHQAWAAYLIGRDRRTELLPLLLDRVAQYHDFGPPITVQDFEQTAAMSVVLDTLIQLDAAVPSRHTMDLFPRFPAQALILLAASPVENREVLFSLMDQAKSDEVWLGAGNLLANTRAAGLGAKLMKEITVQAEVTVTSGEVRGFGGDIGSGSGAMCRGLGLGPLESDWPKAGQYALTLLPSQHDRILAAGKRPVYYRRFLGQLDDHPWQEGQSSGDRDSYRIEYLAQFMDKTPATLPFSQHPRITTTWSGEELYRAEVEGFLQQQRILFHMLARNLRVREWMTADEERAARLRIVVEVIDVRNNPSTPLPVLSPFSDPGPLGN